jgi:MFS family permease
MVAMGAAPSFGFEMVARLGLGAVGAAAGPAVASLTGDLFPRRERARIYGFVLTGELVGAAFGFLVSGNVAAALSWRFAFWVLAIPSAVLAWALPRLLPEPARGGASRLPSGAKRIPTAGQDERHDEPEEESDDGEEGAAKVVRELGVEPDPDRVLRADPTQMGLVPAVRHILRIRTNVVLIAASALGYFFFAGLQTFAVAFLRRHFSLGQSLATTALVALGIGAVAGVLAGGRVADRALDHGRVEARVVVPAVAYAAAALILAPAILTPSLLVAMPLYLLAAAALAAPNPPLDAARLDIMPSRLWGRAEGVRTVLRQLAQAAAPVAFGATADAFGGHGGSGLQYAFLIMLIPLGVSGVIVWRGRRSYPRDVATALASEETIARRRASPQPGEDAGGAPRRSQPRAGRFSHQRPRHG